MNTLDNALHDLYFDMGVEDGGINWTKYTNGRYSYYYAKKSLYLVKHNCSNVILLVKAKNPSVAIEAMRTERRKLEYNE